MNKKLLVLLALFVTAFLAAFGVRIGFPVAETFMQRPVGMPLDAPGMGPFDGVPAGWATSEPAPIISGLPSQSDTSNQVMFLANNRISTECCPSAFTMDTGCVCLTEKDKTFMMHRGGNRA